MSLGQNPPKPCLNNQLNKNKAFGAENSMGTDSDGSSFVNKETDDIDHSVEPTSRSSDFLLTAKTTDQLLNSSEGTSSMQSRHLRQERNQSLDLSLKEKSTVINPSDPFSNSIAPQGEKISSLSPALSADVTEISFNYEDANASNSQIACCAEGASNEGNAPNFAVLGGFDPLSSAANGTVLVPVLVPSHQVSEKDSKRFDPLGTPKRSGSRLLGTGNLPSYTEFSVVQQVSAYTALSHIEVPNSDISAALPVQPVRAPAAAPVIQPLPQNPPHTDPFDEIALRHGKT